jgi:hypothetical protein
MLRGPGGNSRDRNAAFHPSHRIHFTSDREADRKFGDWQLRVIGYLEASATCLARDRKSWVKIVTFLLSHITSASFSPSKAALSTLMNAPAGTVRAMLHPCSWTRAIVGCVIRYRPIGKDCLFPHSVERGSPIPRRRQPLLKREFALVYRGLECPKYVMDLKQYC